MYQGRHTVSSPFLFITLTHAVEDLGQCDITLKYNTERHHGLTWNFVIWVKMVLNLARQGRFKSTYFY